MAVVNDGNATKQIVFLLKGSPNTIVPSLPISSLIECCSDFALHVFGDVNSSLDLNNDRNGFVFNYGISYTAATLYLEKYDGTTWNTSATLTGSAANGTDYLFGFFVNTYKEKYAGYQIKWKLVLTNYGEGTYRVRADGVSGLGGTTSQYSAHYCVYQYTANRANGTVRLEWVNNNLIGNKDNDKVFFDYGNLNWYNSLRVPGYFGFPSGTINREYNRYDNGFRPEVSNLQELEFLLQVYPTCKNAHDLIQYRIVQNESILITDYNANNVREWIYKEVQCTSAYNPVWKPLLNRLSSIELKFRQSNNNLLKRFQ